MPPPDSLAEPSLSEIAREWGRIGCIGFGGPPAHVALFRVLPVTADDVVAGLRRTPLLSIAEMSAALDADRAAHGIYAWWLVNTDAHLA